MKPRDPAKVEALYQAALALNTEVGLRAMTVPMLAERAGIGVGTFYVYFEGKETLWKELYWKLKRESGEAAFAQAKGPLRPRLRQLCRNYFLYKVFHPQETRFVEAYYGSEFVDDETTAFSDQWVKPLHELIRQGQEEDLVVAGPPALLLRCVLGILREGAVHAWVTGSGEAHADQVADIALAAVSS